MVSREQGQDPGPMSEGGGSFLRKPRVCLALKDAKDFGEWRTFQ